VIEIRQLTKLYGLSPVLRGVNLQVGRGEFVGLVGANGAGKTTLMRIVATLLSPTSGEVLLGGWPLPSHADKVRQHLGMVSHQSMVYGDLTAAENLRFFGELYGVKELQIRIPEILDQVGLKLRRDDYVRTFSRGMMQRLTIARATIHNPDVLLLDEPYTGLDQAASELLDGLLREQHGLGRTILMITHDLTHGLNLCERVAILHRGKIAAEVEATAVSPTEFLELYQETIRRKTK